MFLTPQEPATTLDLSEPILCKHRTSTRLFYGVCRLVSSPATL